MNHKSILISFSFFWCSINHLAAQSINELLELAISSNIELKILKSEYSAALEKAPQVNQFPDPEFGIGVFPFPVETRLGAQITRISATQMFPWFGTLDKKEYLELAKAKAVYERIAARTLNLSFEIKQAYYKLYEVEKEQSIIEKSINIFEALERLALTKVESGKASAPDVLRIQLKTEELKQQLELLETTKRIPQIEINQLLNRDLNIPIKTVDQLVFAQLNFEKDTLLANIKAEHPLIRIFELQQNISKQAISLNERNGKPTFGLGLDYIMVNKRNDAEPIHNGRDIVQVRAAIKIPINRKKYEAKEREEQYKIDALDHKKENTLSLFSANIEKAYARYEVAKTKINLYNKQIKITKAAISILESTYSVQGKRFDELLGLEKNMIDYDLQILKAIVDSHLAKNSMEKYLMK